MTRSEFIAVSVGMGTIGGVFAGIIVGVAAQSFVTGAVSAIGFAVAWPLGSITGWEAREQS